MHYINLQRRLFNAINQRIYQSLNISMIYHQDELSVSISTQHGEYLIFFNASAPIHQLQCTIHNIYSTHIDSIYFLLQYRFKPSTHSNAESIGRSLHRLNALMKRIQRWGFTINFRVNLGFAVVRYQFNAVECSSRFFFLQRILQN